MAFWDLLTNKADLATTKLAALPAPDDVELAEGQVLLAVERFAFTANNVTYGVIGEQFGYWKFFPAPDGWGRIPVWGYATVVRSAVPDIAEGLRIFGYLPMSTHFVANLKRTRRGLVDAAEHRAMLPPTYNQYSEAPATAMDDHRALLRPLFMTSFLIDDWLAEAGDFGARSVVLSSASSKTALGLAWCLAQRGVKVTGLTSPRNVDFLRGLGFYDRVVTYDAVPALEVEGPAVFVDFAGDPKVVSAVHNRLGAALVHSAIVGGTHWQSGAFGRGDPLPGPAPALFFAPDQIRKRAADWGPEVLDQRFAEAMERFVAANGWLRLEHHQGPEALQAVYAQVLDGRATPDAGHIIKPA